MNKKIFCVGLNGKAGNLEAILENFAPHIHEVFAAAPPTLMGSGRAGQYPLSLKEIEKHVKIAHECGVGYNALLNAVCLEGRQFQIDFQKQLHKFLEFVCETGIDVLTIADPFVLQKVVAFRKNNGARFIVCVSSLADVTDAFTAERYEELGADRIVLHQNVNRDFKALRQIIKSVSCELELYVNTGSLYKCPYRQAHRVFISHLSTLSPEELQQPKHENWFKANCIAIRRKNPLEIIMAPTIRPEDIHYYEDIGIRLFKISARTMPTEWAIKVLSAYIDRFFYGNIADLCDTNLGQKMPFVDNKKMGNLLELIEKNSKNYSQLCSEFSNSILYPQNAKKEQGKNNGN